MPKQALAIGLERDCDMTKDKKQILGHVLACVTQIMWILFCVDTKNRRIRISNHSGNKKTKTADQIRCIICDNKAKKEIGTMYYVPDGTKKCGYYECKKCGNRFLSLQTMEKIPCPDCEAEIDYEIGPDESMEDILDTAQLLQKIEGEEEVEKMDALLSLAITGGDCNWI